MTTVCVDGTCNDCSNCTTKSFVNIINNIPPIKNMEKMKFKIENENLDVYCLEANSWENLMMDIALLKQLSAKFSIKE